MNWEIELDLRTTDRILIDSDYKGIEVTVNVDSRDVIDQIECKLIRDWKGEDILKEFSKEELLLFIDQEYGLD